MLTEDTDLRGIARRSRLRGVGREKKRGGGDRRKVGGRVGLKGKKSKGGGGGLGFVHMMSRDLQFSALDKCRSQQDHIPHKKQWLSMYLVYTATHINAYKCNKMCIQTNANTLYCTCMLLHLCV